jgi:hypothetical protein
MKVLVVDGARILQERLLLGKNVHVRYVKCGREGCACTLGKKHGPYYYIRKKVNGKYKDTYVSVKERKHIDLPYEIVQHDLILDVKGLSELPPEFNECNVFAIKDKLR